MKALLIAFVTLLNMNAYSNVSCPSPTRQKLLHTFKPNDVRKIKVAFFDADSTLRVSLSGAVSANSPKDVKLLPYMVKELRKLATANYLIYVVSNQGGVESGAVSCETADKALKYTLDLVKKEGAIIHGYDFAEAKGAMRKPDVGMGKKLEEILKNTYGPHARIDKGQSLMVGDSAYKKNVDIGPEGKFGTHFSNSDRLFAENYGIPFYEPAVFFGWREFGIDVFDKAQQVDEFIKFCSENSYCLGKLK